MQKKRLLIASLALVLAAALIAGVYLATRPEGTTGKKAIAITIATDAGSETTTLHTDAAFLGDALTEAGLIAGEEGPYGLYVTSAGGITADESKQQWWGFSKGGELLSTGVDETPIADGEAYEITLHTGW